MPVLTKDKVVVRGCVQVQSLLDFSMQQAPGEHTHGRLVGMVTGETVKKQLLDSLADAEIRIMHENDSVIFAGILSTYEIESHGEYHEIVMQLNSGSILLDQVKKSRSFQNRSMTYGQVVQKVLNTTPGAAAIMDDTFANTPIGTALIQYCETDWQFIKRLASHFNLPVIPHIESGSPQIYIGVPSLRRLPSIQVENCSTQFSSQYYVLGGSESGLPREAFLQYRYDCLDNYPVGATVAALNGLHICGKCCRIEDDIAVFSYILADPRSFCVRRIEHTSITGMSLLGKVIKTDGEDVWLHLDIDEDQSPDEACPFPWTPPTGNLMYLMPKVGTTVSLYFAAGEESAGQVTNVVRSNGGLSNGNPENRALVTEHNKAMNLYPNTVGFHSLDNFFELDDDLGVVFNSTGSFVIVAANDVIIEGKEVRINGGKFSGVYKGVFRPEEDGEVAKRMLDGDSDWQLGDAEYDDLRTIIFEPQTVLDILCEGTIQSSGITNFYIGSECVPLDDFNDDPLEGDYDAMQTFWQAVIGGAVVVGIAVVCIAVPPAGLTAVGVSVLTVGGTMVVTTAIHDASTRTNTGNWAYAGKVGGAIVVGILSGAAGVWVQGKGLIVTMAVAAGSAFVSDAAIQYLNNGEVDWAQARRSAVAAAIAAGVSWIWKNGLPSWGGDETGGNSIVRDVENGDVALNSNMEKGNYGEMKVDELFEENGFSRVSGDQVTSLGDPTHHGIDGVYFRDNPPPPIYVIAESKYGSSGLGYTQSGRQMSEPWILDRLESAVSPQVYADIQKNGYTSVLVNVVDSSGNYQAWSLDELAKKISEWNW